MDRDRLRGLQAGDDEVWEKTFWELHPALLSYFAGRRGSFDDGVEDLAQTTLQRVAAKVGKFPLDDCDKFEGWVFTIAENVFKDSARKEHRERKKYERFYGEVQDLSELLSEVVGELDDRDLRDDVRAALASLPDRQREAVRLKYFHGWSAKEVARKMGISAGTVSQHLHRGILALRAHLERQNAARADPCR